MKETHGAINIMRRQRKGTREEERKNKLNIQNSKAMKQSRRIVTIRGPKLKP